MSPVENLTRRWVAAWAHTRGLEVGEVAGWPKVYVASASRATEIVCADPDGATWAALLDQVRDDPSAMLSVVSRLRDEYDVPPDVRIDRDDETLMVLHPETRRWERDVDLDGLDVDHERDGDRITIRLVAEERVVAEGTVGLLGPDAAYDMVETLLACRRRGLASWVMTELGRAAAQRGASTGLLAATEDGAALYRSLGWVDVAPVRSVTGSPPAQRAVGSDCTSTNTSFSVGSATM
ncbi:MAG: GNAT family N-acetyltransferase [Marmoricola sp.]